MTKLLALDQASIITGWSVFEDQKLIKYGHITLDRETPVGIRLVQLRDKVKELIKEYQVNEIALEDIQMQNTVGNNVVTFKVLAQVLGVLQELCEEMEISYTIIPSVTWKAGLGIKGRGRAEQKRNAQSFVINEYGVKPTQDESDSICIGTYHGGKKITEINWA